MISTNFNTPFEIQRKISQKAREKRLTLNLTQQSLAQKSGVSLGVLKKFEKTSQISLESLLKLALILQALDDFENLFNTHQNQKYASLDELIKEKTKKETLRKRGRK